MPRRKKIALTQTKPEKKTTVDKEVKEREVFYSATGRRKSAIAQVKLNLNGKGRIVVNNKDLKEYFPYFVWQQEVLDPLKIANLKNADLSIKVKGGGLHAQAESIRLGVARALVQYNSDLRKVLKPAGFLKRDPRIKERKKPGLKRARRAPQWSKR